MRTDPEHSRHMPDGRTRQYDPAQIRTIVNRGLVAQGVAPMSRFAFTRPECVRRCPDPVSRYGFTGSAISRCYGQLDVTQCYSLQVLSNLA